MSDEQGGSPARSNLNDGRPLGRPAPWENGQQGPQPWGAAPPEQPRWNTAGPHSDQPGNWPQWNGQNPAGAPWNGPAVIPAPPPAPRPGTLWLRQQELSDIFSTGFATLRANFGTSIGIMAAPALVMGALVVAAVVVGAVCGVFETVANSETPPTSTIVVMVVGVSLLLLAMLAATSTASAANIHLFAQSALGRKTTASQALARGLRRMPALVAIGLIILAAMLIPVILMGSVIAVAFANESFVIGLLAFVVLAPVLLVAWIALMPRLCYASYAAVLEKRGPIESLRRSWALTRGRFWRTFGIVTLISVVASLPANLVAAPLQFVGPLLPDDSDAGSSSTTGVVLALVLTVLVVFTVLCVLVQALMQTFTSAAIGALYADARIRDEGLGRQIADATRTFHPTPPDAPVTFQPGEMEFPLPR